MRIYLDSCCFNRPYDNQSNQHVSMETRAIQLIQNEIRTGNIELATSYISRYENDKSPFLVKKTYIEDFIQKYSTVYVTNEREVDMVSIAKNIIDIGIKQYDAYHVACAILAKCDYFLSTDKRLLRYKTHDMYLLNPVDFLNVYGGNEK